VAGEPERCGEQARAQREQGCGWQQRARPPADAAGCLEPDDRAALNNLALVAFTFTVLLGTLFPILAEAVRGVKVSVGAPFFNRMTLPICVSLIFLMGVGPLARGLGLRWRAGLYLPPDPGGHHRPPGRRLQHR
jgi:hypothetical protein